MTTPVTLDRPEAPAPPRSRHLLSITDLGRDGIEEILRLTDTFVEVSARSIPKVPALRGKTVASVFFEDSTRTRLSFETAARRLSADVMTFAASASSLSKGESLRDTVETIHAMGVDALVVRHRCAGVPWQVAGWLSSRAGHGDPQGGDSRTGTAVVNAGDGWHEHPTQALLDCYTICQQRMARGLAASGHATLDGVRVAIVGDIRHSRVARSGVLAFSALGANVTLVAPPTLLPASLDGWPVTVSHNLDEAVVDADVVYVLRLQRERMLEALLPSLREYTATYGLTAARADRMMPDALIMHPGPVNRGVEVAAEVADRPTAVISTQVANGVAVRMAVLYLLLGSGLDRVPG